MTSGWNPWVLTEADDLDDELETVLGGVNAAETFLLPLERGLCDRRGGMKIASFSRHLTSSSVNTGGPAGRPRDDPGGTAGRAMVGR